jgi:putative nucleotidyltransferase with HDIG domain
VRLYVWSAMAAGAVPLLLSSWHHVNWGAFVALFLFHGIFTSAVPLRMRRGFATSAAFAIILAAEILLPPGAAGVVAGLGVALQRPRLALLKLNYNVAQALLSAAAGSAVYRALGGQTVLRAWDFPSSLRPIIAAIVVTCLLNDILVAAVVSIAGTDGFKHALRLMIKEWPGRFAYGLLGILIAVLWNGTYGALAVVLAPAPLCVAGWAYLQYSAEERAYNGTIRSMIQALEIKDYYTRGHSERVGRAAAMIGESMHLKEKQIEMLRFAGMLHDIGKLSVPTTLLAKDGPLTPDERAVIQSHPVRGVDMVREIDFLEEAYNAIMHHHERFDGRGYPAGLAADRIPVYARIIAVADAFDCMTSTRSYRRARTVDEAVAELWHCAGTQFDPAMVRGLVSALAAAEARGEPWRPTTEPPAATEGELCGVRYDDDDPHFARLMAGEDVASGAGFYQGAGFGLMQGYGYLPDGKGLPGRDERAGVDDAERETP